MTGLVQSRLHFGFVFGHTHLNDFANFQRARGSLYVHHEGPVKNQSLPM